MKKIERIKDRIIITLVFLVTIILAVLLLMSCNVREENGSVYVTTTIDSCEYIISGSLFNDGNITHKGNCRYCIERNKKLIREQVDSVLIDIYD